MSLTRRRLMQCGSIGAAALAGLSMDPTRASAEDWGAEIVERLVGGRVIDSMRIALVAPAAFPLGTSVPVDIEVDTPMIADDHLRSLRVFAPLNPIVEIVGFGFEPGLGIPRVSTRIRLAGPQHVVAVAEMSDGALLTARRFVEVGTNGCSDH